MFSLVLRFIINAEYVPINSLRLGEAMLVAWLGDKLLCLILEEPITPSPSVCATGGGLHKGHLEYKNQGMKLKLV